MAAAAIVLWSPSPARATAYYWGVPSGNWSQAVNWGGTVPGYSDNATIDNGGTATVSLIGQQAWDLYLGNTAGSGTLNMTAGGLAVNGEYVGYSGSGGFTQSGGINTVSNLYLGYGSTGVGTYNFGGGNLSATYGYVGYSGTGTFTQSGGTTPFP